MSDPPFITLTADGMQPRLQPGKFGKADAIDSKLDTSPASSLSLRTYDTSCAKYHIDQLGTFAARLHNAATSIFPNKGRSRYNNVRVLLLRWAEDTMGVQWELEDLANVFKSVYGFETEIWLIPTVRSHLALMAKCLQVVEEFGRTENLLVVYYAGHGLMNSSRQAMWTCNSDINYASLQWYGIQTLFEQAESDVLLLLDCCAAASGAPADGDSSSVTETIAACGFETWAPQPGRHSFTNTLIAVLDAWQNRPSFTAGMLHCEILNRLRHEKPETYRSTKNFECRKSPIHIISTSDPKARGVEIGRQKSPCLMVSANSTESKVLQSKGVISSIPKSGIEDEIAPSDLPLLQPSSIPPTISDGPSNMASLLHGIENDTSPKVQITLALEEDQELDFEKCRRWLQDFPVSARYAHVQGTCAKRSTRNSAGVDSFNVYTECGRHGDDWLFGDFSLGGVAKKIWKNRDRGGIS